MFHEGLFNLVPQFSRLGTLGGVLHSLCGLCSCMFLCMYVYVWCIYMIYMFMYLLSLFRCLSLVARMLYHVYRNLQLSAQVSFERLKSVHWSGQNTQNITFSLIFEKNHCMHAQC